MLVNIIKGTLWSLETEKKVLFFFLSAFDLEAKTHENVSSLFKLRFSNLLLFLKEENHICINVKKKKKGAEEDLTVHVRTLHHNISKLTRSGRGRERCLLNLTVTVYSAVKLITLNYYMKVSCGRLDSANLTVVF